MFSYRPIWVVFLSKIPEISTGSLDRSWVSRMIKIVEVVEVVELAELVELVELVE